MFSAFVGPRHYSLTMNTLHPEPRPDINGKVTTRWVRSDKKKTSKALAAAVPTLAMVTVNPVTSRNVPVLFDLLMDHSVAGEGVEVEDFKPEVAHEIEKQLLAVFRKYGEYSYEMDRARDTIADAFDESWTRARHPTKSELRHKPDDFSLLYNLGVLGCAGMDDGKYVINGVRKYPQFENVVDFSELLPNDLMKAQALSTVIRGVSTDHQEDNGWNVSASGKYDTRYVRLRDDALTDLVVEYPERADDIVNIINGRNTADVSLIRSVLENPLGDGVL